MEINPVTVSPPPATIQHLLVLRETQLEAWSHLLEKEAESVVNKFAQAIFDEIKKQIDTTTSNPYYDLYSQHRPLEKNYHLTSTLVSDLFLQSLPQQSIIRTWFPDRDIPNETKETKQEIEDKESLANAIDLSLPANQSKFNLELAVIGESVKDRLQDLFSKFQAKEENKLFNYHVHWHTEHTAAILLSKIPTYSNHLKVKAWIYIPKEDANEKEHPVESKVSKKPITRTAKVKKQLTDMFKVKTKIKPHS